MHGCAPGCMTEEARRDNDLGRFSLRYTVT
jgi:hypothetical protein